MITFYCAVFATCAFAIIGIIALIMSIIMKNIGAGAFAIIVITGAIGVGMFAFDMSPNETHIEASKIVTVEETQIGGDLQDKEDGYKIVYENNDSCKTVKAVSEKVVVAKGNKNVVSRANYGDDTHIVLTKENYEKLRLTGKVTV